MEQYTLKLTSGTSYRLYQGSTLVTDSALTTLFSTAGSAYFNFDFNGGTPSATNTAVIVDSNGVTIVTITATILDSANYKGVWGDSATTFTSFDSLSGKSLDESQLSFLMGEIKESPVVGTDISTVIDTAFVSTANIQSDAVTTPKIADYNVTAEKLASESITTAKIEDGAVTSDKIDWTTTKTILYEDSTGANDTVPLSDNPRDYDLLEIIFKDGASGTARYSSLFGSTANMGTTPSITIKKETILVPSAGTIGIEVKMATLQIWSTSSGHSANVSRWGTMTFTSSGITQSTDKDLYITKVIGYK